MVGWSILYFDKVKGIIYYLWDLVYIYVIVVGEYR